MWFRQFLHDLDANENLHIKMACNSYQFSVDNVSDDIVQEEFLELIKSTAAKEEFQEQHLSISNWWAKMLFTFPKDQ